MKAVKIWQQGKVPFSKSQALNEPFWTPLKFTHTSQQDSPNHSPFTQDKLSRHQMSTFGAKPFDR